MRISEDEGVKSAFGFGYKALRRGTVFHIFQCRETEVTYRHLANETRDMPITFYDSEGIRREGFLDTVTRQIKNSTIMYHTFSNSLPTTWDTQEGSYKCRSRTGLVDCGTPALLSVNVEKIKDALKQKRDTIVYSGTLDDIPEEILRTQREYEKDFRMDVEYNNNVETKGYILGQQILEKNASNVFRAFGMPNFQQEVTQAMDNTGIIGILPTIIGTITGVFCVLFAICKLCYLYRDPNYNFWNIRNMFLIIFVPSKLYSAQEEQIAEENEISLKKIKIDLKRSGIEDEDF